MQQGRRAVYPPGEAREDWTIIRALSEVLGRKLAVDTGDDVRARMAEVSPSFAAGPDAVGTAPWGAFGTDGPMDPAPFRTPVANFYMTDPISRASVTMAACADALAGAQRERTGTDG